jgi:Metallo-peptidase family M12/FlgD Ig-like domain
MGTILLDSPTPRISFRPLDSMRTVSPGAFVAALSILAVSAAHAGATEVDALQQRLGVSRMSVQSLRLGSYERTIPLDLGGRHVTLVLERSDLRAPDFRVLVQAEDGALHESPAPPAANYRGTVLEIPGSVVGGTIRNGQLHAAVALGDGRLFYVQPLSEVDPESGPDRHAVYDAADVVDDGGTCATSERQVIVPPVAEGGAAATVIRTAEIAFDADFEFFTLNGSSVNATVADIENVMSAVNAVYERDCALTHQITTVIVRSVASDPYTSTDPTQVLTEFRNHWNASQTGVVRDVAHLMTGKNIDGGTIGISSVGAVCNRSRAYGVSQSRFTSNQGRRCTLTAHELGHSWNAVHCDGVTPCNIMCSSVGGCDGIGLPNFEPMGINAITSFAANLGCLTPPVGVGDTAPREAVRLAPPTPSPSTGETALSFFVPVSIRAELDICDVTGRLVARLASGTQEPGWHYLVWSGRDDDGRSVTSGVYYARLHASGATVTRTLIMLR